MAENKFEDTISSIQQLIDLFLESDTISRYRNRQFEEDVRQIVTRKSISNFELFAYSFDVIYDNQY